MLDALQCWFCPTASSSAPLNITRTDFYVQSQEEPLSMWPPKRKTINNNNNNNNEECSLEGQWAAGWLVLSLTSSRPSEGVVSHANQLPGGGASCKAPTRTTGEVSPSGRGWVCKLPTRKLESLWA